LTKGKGSMEGSRKASPPRPTLLVGNITDCQIFFRELKHRVEDLIAEDQKPSAQTFQAFVPKFRSLRETLVHLDEKGQLCLDAYELSADVCWRAGDWAEFLKCAQQLLYAIYPRFYPEACEVAGSDAPERGRPRGGRAGIGRLPEFTAAQVLYFSCVVPEPRPFEVASLLRRTPPTLLGEPLVRLAVRLSGCVFSGDHLRFLRLSRTDELLSSHPMVRGLAGCMVPRARGEAMRALACAFRTLPLPAASDLLCCGDLTARGSEEVHRALKAAAKRGSREAAAALEAVASSAFVGESGPPEALRFRQ